MATKISPEMLDWKPTEGQRSLLELLHYISHIWGSYALLIATGSMDHFKKNSDHAEAHVTLWNFIETMDEQASIISDIFGQLTVESFEKEIPFFGGVPQKQKQIILFMLKNLVGYRMQLFLYLKQAGRPELVTSNLRMGKDPQ